MPFTVYLIRLTSFFSVASNCIRQHSSGLAVIFLITVLPTAVNAQVVISEVFYDAPRTDAREEWVEVQNVGTATVDITKWKVHDGAGHVLNVPPKNGGVGSLQLVPHAYAILASDASAFRAEHARIGSAIIDTALSLNNDSESISLLNASGTIIASVGYSSSDGAAGDGNSLQRSGGGWVAAPPTPGAANAIVSAPGSNAKQPPTPKAVKAPKSSKVANVTKKSTTATSKTAAYGVASDPASMAPESDGETLDAMAFSTTSLAHTASVLPVNSMWLWAIVGLAAVTGGGVLASRYVARDEWEIEDVTEDA